MAFCKICICGEKVIFETILGYPDNCPSCGRKLVEFMTYDTDDPTVEQIIKKNEEKQKNDSCDEKSCLNELENADIKYVLKLNDGREIEIPDSGCIIGRTETGAEELAEFPSVSRKHISITPRRNIGVIIEDLSSYGTFVDGKRIEKNTPVRVIAGSRVTLCEIETVLTIKETKEL